MRTMNWQRVLSFTLALVMVLGMIPGGVITFPEAEAATISGGEIEGLTITTSKGTWDYTDGVITGQSTNANASISFKNSGTAAIDLTFTVASLELVTNGYANMSIPTGATITPALDGQRLAAGTTYTVRGIPAGDACSISLYSPGATSTMTLTQFVVSPTGSVDTSDADSGISLLATTNSLGTLNVTNLGAAVTQNATDGTATWESKSANSISASLYGTYGKGSGFAYYAWYNDSSTTLTFTNNYSNDAEISFDYTITVTDGDTVKIGGTAYTGTDKFTALLSAGGTLTVQLNVAENKTAYGIGLSANGATINITNITLVEKQMTTVTFTESEGGTYTVDGTAVGSLTENPIKKESTESFALVATPSDGYSFAGWYNATTDTYLSSDATYSAKFAGANTVTAKFVKTEDGIFGVGDARFMDLNAAAQSANGGSVKTIVVLKDAELPAGDYTIPSGVTLLVPCMDGDTGLTGEAGGSPDGKENAKEVLYRTLTIPQGVTMTVNGTLIVNAEVGQKGYANAEQKILGKYGQILLEGDIEVKGELMCFGYIKGDGTVSASENGSIGDLFILENWRGGTYASMTSGYLIGDKILPILSYRMHNIQTKIIINQGASLIGLAKMTADNEMFYTTFEIFGDDSGVFRLTEGYLEKTYVDGVDKYLVDGNISIASISLTLKGMTLNTAQYVFPIAHGMDITLTGEGTVCTVANNIKMMPGSSVYLDAGTKLVINDGISLTAVNATQNFDECNLMTLPKYADAYIRMHKDAQFDVQGAYGGYLYAINWDNVNIDAADYTNGVLQTTIKEVKTYNGATDFTNADYTYVFTQMYCDYSDVLAALETAGALGTLEGEYTADSIAALTTEIANANNSIANPLTNTTENQATVDALAAAITSAIDNLTYTVTLDAKGGTGVPATLTLKYSDTAYTGLTDPTRPGYTFGGWENESGATVTGTSVPTKGHHTLTAQWTPNTDTAYTVEHYWMNEDGTYSATTTDTESKAGTTDTTATVDAHKNPQDGFSVDTSKSVDVNIDGDGKAVLKIYYARNTSTITFNTNGGTAISPITGLFGTDVDYPGNPTKRGYDFLNWYTGDDYSVSATVPTKMPEDDLTLKANWSANSYTISYDLKGGSINNTNPESYTVEETVTLYPPTKTGHTFGGWKLTNEGVTTLVDGVETPVAVGTIIDRFPAGTYIGDMTLEAVWNANTYTVTFDAQGGTACNGITVVYDSAYGELPEPTKTGYEFGGWYTGINGTGSPVTAASIHATADGITLYAKWTVETYTIDYELGGGSITNTNPESYTVAGDVTLYPPTKPGHTFGGWKLTNEGVTTLVYGVETPVAVGTVIDSFDAGTYIGNMTLEAVWNANSYTVTFDAQGGTACDVISVTYGSAYGELPAPTKTGYEFGGWYTGINGTGSPVTAASIHATADGITLYAKWTVETYTIDYELGGGSVSGTNPTSYTVESGRITLINPTRTGYTFAGWTGTGLTEAAMTVTISAGSTGNRTYTANWTPIEYEITYELNGGSVDGTNPINYTIESGSITLINPTKTGYTFAGWTGTGLSQATMEVTISTGSVGARNYTATWTPNEDTAYKVEHYWQDLNGAGYTLHETEDKVGTTASSVTPGVKEYLGFTAPGTQTVEIKADGSLVVQYYYTRNEYTITFKPNGGTGNEYAQTFAYGDGAALSANTYTRTGYHFLGWSTTTDNTVEYVDGAVIDDALVKQEVNKGITLYAVWEIDRYHVIYAANGGTGITTEQTFTYGQSVDAHSAPTKSGYTFDGWKGSNGMTYGAEEQIQAGETWIHGYTLTLTAQWTANSYTVSFDANGGSACDAINVTFDAAYGTLLATTREGYDFGGWYANEDLSGAEVTADTIYTVAGNSTLYAKWIPTANQYTIEYYEMDTKGDYVQTSTQTVTEGVKTEQVVSINPNAPTGFALDNEKGVLSGTVAADGSTVLKVYYSRNQYTVTWDVDGDKTTETYYYGAEVIEKAAPSKEGHTFDSWTGYTDGMLMPAGDVEFAATWTVNNYTVTWIVDSEETKETYAYGADINAPADPVKAGYTFTGWSPAVSATMGAADAAYTATWTPNTYKVSFDLNYEGAQDHPAEQPVTFGNAYGELPAPDREGYTFDGWYADADCNGDKVTAETLYTVAGDSTLYAKWTINQYTITFYSDKNEPMFMQTQDYGTEVEPFFTPSKTGYNFNCWVDEDGNKVEFPITMPAKDQIITATWTPIWYTVTFHPGEGVEGTSYHDTFYYDQTKKLPPYRFNREGYAFVGWADSDGTTYSDQAAVWNWTTEQGANFDLYAQWDADSINYTVEYYLQNVDGNGYTKDDDRTKTFTADMDSMTAVDATQAGEIEGFTFEKADNITISVDADNVVKVYYTRNPYTVTWIVDSQSTQETYVYGQTISMPQDPTKTGYDFAGWTPNVPVTMSAADAVYTAQWTPVEYTITYELDDGTVSGTNPGKYTIESETFTLINPTKTGYTFAGWTWAGQTEPVQTVTVVQGSTEDRTYTAKWTVNQYTITFVLDNGQDDVVLTRDYGTAVTAPAGFTKTGYTFANWDAEVPATMPAENVTITAQWTANTNTAYKVEHYLMNVDGSGYTLFETENRTGTTDAEVTPDVMSYEGFTAPDTQTVTIAPDGSLVVVYRYTRNQYKVFWAVDGTKTEETYYYGAKITERAAPTKTGYDFKEWSGYTDNMIMPAESLTFTATWTPKSYDVAFQANGGTVKPISQTVTFDSAYGELPTPERKGYVFAGWYTMAEGGTEVTAETVVDSETPHTLYAHWTPGTTSYTVIHWQQNVLDDAYTKAYEQTVTNAVTEGTTAAVVRQYPGFTAQEIQQQTIAGDGSTVVNVYYDRNIHTLTWNANNGVMSGDYTVGQVRYGTPITAPTVSRNGYDFINWGATVVDTMPDHDLTYGADWRLLTYNISYNGMAGASNTNPGTYTVETETFTLAEPTKTGYTFLGWTWDGKAEPVKNVTVEQGTYGDLAYTANWQINQYTITFVLGNGEDNIVLTQYYDTAVEAPADPTREGYTFTGWDAEIPGAMPAEDMTITAKWEINQYTITFANTGDTVMDAITQDYGTAVKAPADPTRKGYTFSGWDKDIPATMLAENVTITAKWTANTYTVVFDANGGTGTMENQSLTWDEGPKTLTDNAYSRMGYTFLGWALTADATTAKYADEAEVSNLVSQGSITLYAVWKLDTYTIGYVLGGGNVAAANPTSYTVETDSFTLTNPTKTGYTFLGWTWEGQTEPVVTVTVAKGTTTGNRTYTANWEANTYTVVFDANGGTGTMDDQTLIWDDSAKTLTVNAYSRSGYTFRGWALTADAATAAYADEAEVSNLVSQGSITLYAVWQINTYTIGYTLNGGNVAAANPGSYTVETDSFTLVNPTKTGYTFLGWTVNGGTEKTLEMTVAKGTTGDLQFEAHWQINTYSITFHSDGGDQVEPIFRNYLGQVIASDVTNPTKEGYTFIAWYLDEALTQRVTYPVTMTADLEFYAKWEINQYTITFMGTGDTVIDPITQDYGTDVVAPADPVKTGYTFIGWDVAIPGTMPAENITITAKWEINQYTISFMGTGDTVIDPITQDYGTAVTAPADPTRKGYTFAGWDVEIPNTMPAEDTTITALWTINQYSVIFDANGGGAMAPIEQDYQTQVATLPDAVRAGYRFDGWFYADGTQVALPITLEEDVTIVAYWTSYLELLMAIKPADFANAENGGEDREVLEQARAYFNLMKLDGQQLALYQGSQEPYASHWDALEAEIREVALLELEYSIESDETLGKVNGLLAEDGSAAATLEVNAEENHVDVWIEDPDRLAADFLTIPFLTTLLNDRNIWSIHFPAIEGETDNGTPLTPYGNGVESLDQLNLMIRVAYATINTPEITGKEDKLTYSEFFTWLQQNRDITIGVLDGKNVTIVVNGKTPEGVEFSTTYVMNFCNRAHDVTWDVDGVTTTETYDYETPIVKPADPVKEGYTFTGWEGYTGGMTMGKTDVTFKATWSINSYNVTWNVDGTTTTESYQYGQTIVPPQAPAKEGHTFTGWSGYTEGMIMPAGNLTFTAVWDVLEFTVTFNSDGGDSVGSITQEYGTQVDEPEEPTKTGYTFAGWYNGNTKVEFPLTMPAGGLNLKAKWTVNQYTITVVLGNGQENITITKDYNTVVAEPAAPSKEGYTFAGWDAEIPAYMPAENVTITALWTVNQYTITFVLGNGQADIVQTLNYGDNLVLPETPEKVGHSFAGWDGYTEGMTVPAGNVTITALWTPNQYTVTLDAAGGTVEPEALTVTYGQPYGLPIPVRDGYTFDGWFCNGVAISATVDITADATFVAHWTLGNPYNISYDLADGQWAEGTSPRVQYTVETDSFILPQPVREGYTFAGWTGTGLTEATLEVTVAKGSTGDRSYTATWTINSYDVTWDVDGVTTTETYEYGAVIELPAAPAKEGHTFAGWTGYTEGMTMPAGDVTFTAAWTVNQYTITFVQGNGHPDIVKTQNYGTAVTAPADPSRTGYTFGGWDKTVPATMPAENLVITARWTVNQYTITFVQGNGEADIVLTQDYGTAVTAPADPDREGHTFGGWDVTIPETMPAENLVITARWTINRYTITFVRDNGEADIVLTQDYGTAVTAPADPTREGYTFGGWDKTVPGTMPAEDMTITALWEINVYTITFDTAGGTAVEAIQDVYGASITAPADPTREGYTFAGWDVEIPETMPAGDMTITAKWTVNTYTLTYLVDGEVYKTFRLNYGAVVVIEQEPTKTGYTFSGWDQTAMLMPAHDVQISGTFTANDYTVHFDANYPAAPAVDDATVTFDSPYGTLPVVTRTGYTFAGWTLNGEAVTAQTLVKTAGEHTLAAQWTANTYTVTLVLDGGECSVTEVTVTYDGTYAALPTPTREGYDFIGWFDGETQILNDAKVAITADQTLTARWKATGNTPYTVEHYQQNLDGNYVLVLTENLTGAADTLTQAQQQSYTGFHVNASLGVTSGTIAADGSLVLKLYYDRDSYDVVWNVAGRQIRETYLFGQTLNVPDPAWAQDIHARYDFTGWDQELPQTVSESATYTAQYSLYYEATIGSVTYRTLALALENAKSGETVRLARDVTVNEDLTVPKNVLLLIPCKDDDNGYDLKYEGKLNFNYDAPTANGVAALYRTLTVSEGAVLTIEGILLLNSVSGRTSSGEQDITGGYGKMVLNGEAVVENGGLLDCFGFITGTGKVTVQNGGTASDMYIVRNWRGGTQAYNMYVENIYPMNEYDCRNIEVDVVIHYGGSYEGLVKMYAGNEYNYTRYPQVHISNGLIRLTSEDGYVVRSYADGIETYKVYGGADIASSALTILGVDLTTADFLYPIDGDIRYELYGGRYDIVNDYKFLPGSSVLVGSNAALHVAAGVTVVFYQEFNDVDNTGNTEYPAGRAPAVLTVQEGGSFTNAGTFAGHIYTESPDIWIGADPVWDAVTKEANGLAVERNENDEPTYVELQHTLSIERPGHTWHYGEGLSIVWDGYADYSAVQQAIASIPKDLDYYTAESVAAIQPAVDAVIYNLPYERQAEVDAMAIPIQEAVAGLVLRTVTVTLDANGGTVEPSTITATCTMPIGTLPTPTREYHTFQGWFDADGNRVTAKTEIWSKTDMTITAKWRIKTANYSGVVVARSKIPSDMSMYTEESAAAVNAASAAVVTGLSADRQAEVDAMAQAILDAIDNLTYLVTLDADGGIVEPETLVKIRKETDYAGLPTPVRPGYRFDGWFNSEGTQVIESSKPTQGHHTLTARWTVLPADYAAVDAALAQVPADLSFYTDETVAALQAAIDGVVRGLMGDRQAEVDAMAQAILDAIGGLEWYTIQVTFDPNGGTVDVAAKTVEYTKAYGELPVPVNPGHRFDGWFNAAGEQITAETIADTKDNVTLTARWTAIPADYTAVDEALVQVPADLTIYSDDTVQALQEAVDAVVRGLLVDRQDDVDAMARVILDAIEALELRTITVTLDPNGGTVDPAVITVTCTKTFGELPVPVYPGFDFAGWYTADGIRVEAATVVESREDLTLTARWVENMADYTIVENAKDRIPADLSIYSDETVVALNAALENVDYTLTADRQDEVDAMAQAILDAIAALKLYPVQVTFDPNGGTVDVTTMTVEYTQAYGELPVPVRPGYTFDGWFNAAGVQVTAQTIVESKEHVTLTARWTGIPADYSAVENVLDQIPADLSIYTDETVAALNAAVGAVDYTLTADRQDEVEAMAQAILDAIAALEKQTVTVTTDDGHGNTTEREVVFGEPVGELPVPEDECKIFLGWYNAEGEPVTEDTVIDSLEDLTLTAKWQDVCLEETGNGYTITVHYHGGEGVISYVDVTVDPAVTVDAMTLRIPAALPTTRDAAQAPLIHVEVPDGFKLRLEIPMDTLHYGNVVMTDPDMTIINETIVTDDGVALAVTSAMDIRVVENSISFPDVPEGFWAKKNVDYLTARKYLYGNFDGTYAPSETIMRKTVVMMLWRFAGRPEPQSMESPFSDVTDPTDVYYKAILWAYETGVTVGYNDGTFGPDRVILRQHFAAMMYRYADLFGYELPTLDNGQVEDFTDYDQIGASFRDDVQWALDCGLMLGHKDGRYNPQGETPRDQMSAVFFRFLQAYNLAMYEAEPE